MTRYGRHGVIVQGKYWLEVEECRVEFACTDLCLAIVFSMLTGPRWLILHPLKRSTLRLSAVPQAQNRFAKARAAAWSECTMPD